MVRFVPLAAAAAAAFVVLLASPADATPPSAPVILEPAPNTEVNAADVHMETAPFFDADGDAHECTEWEIWGEAQGLPQEIGWVSGCIGGTQRVHTHLGDGLFVNFLNGLSQLEPEGTYRFRVRFKDASGEYSAWSERVFSTGPAATNFPMDVSDVLTAPAPELLTASGNAFVLPHEGFSHAIRLVNGATGQLMLQVESSGPTNQWTNPPGFVGHAHPRLEIAAGQLGLTIPELNLAFSAGDGRRRVVFIPAVSLAPFEVARFWISANGSTYVAHPGQSEPDLSTPVRLNVTPWSTADDFQVTRFATGFQLPVSIAFVNSPGPSPSSPFMYVAELYGNIRMVQRNGEVHTYAANLLNFDPLGPFPGSGEMGLAAICVDPQTGDVFATLLHRPPWSEFAICPKIIRLRSTDGGRTASSETLVYDFAPYESSPSHQISSISISPDGDLFVHMGDALDITAGTNLNNWGGKVLRMTKTGQPLTTNPFYDAGDGIGPPDFVYSYGMRNPFGGAWRRADGEHYIIENGPGADRLALNAPGRNFGYDGTNESMENFATYVWFPSVAPVTAAFVESPVFGRSGFPAEYEGRAYVTLSGATWATGPSVGLDKTIQEVRVNPGGSMIAAPRVVASYNGGGKSSCSAIAAGPDGIYFADLYPESDFQNPTTPQANIFRLSYRVSPDCNANGVNDIDEIGAGAVQDCNGNLVPDPCDVTFGFAFDCDGNDALDECQTTTPVTTQFNAQGLNDWTLNGDAVVQGWFVRIDNAGGGASGEGTIIHPPRSDLPTDRLRIEFNFRMGGPLNGQGFSFALADVLYNPQSTFFGEDGPVRGGLAVKFDLDTTQENQPFVAIMRDRVEVARYVPTFNFADGQFRRCRITFGLSGLTVRIERAPGVWENCFVGRIIEGFEPFVARYGFGALAAAPGAFHDVDYATTFVAAPNDPDGDFVPPACECGDIDFNNDGLFPDNVDLEDYLAVFGGAACPAAACDSIDFNGDGLFPDIDDIIDYFTVFGGGGC
ncbi:MAG TPA: PQQ-dependent sugar dehydrogenase [Phycisphaerales bacterium]|nr:PQQ-dependent sugar dehydrogenase [Phycisphaerales bacterium]